MESPFSEKMSTKTTRKFAQIDNFSLHLYDDFAGSPAIEIWMNGAHAKLPISQEKLDSLDKQLSEQKCSNQN